jgi:O-antigen/teichoic acid export membrane protein
MYRSQLLTNWLSLAISGTRGKERLWRAGLTGMTSSVAKGLAIITGFISVPLTVSYLGQDRYGIWLTINSLLNWLAVSNLSLGGNALINGLSEANGKEDWESARELVATAFWSLAGIAGLLLLVYALVFFFIPWHAVFNTSNTIVAAELHWAISLSFICFVLLFPLNITEAVYLSFQTGYLGNAWSIAGNLASLIALVIVTRFNGGLPLLVLALFGVRILVSLANLWYLFCYEHPRLMPDPRAVTRHSFDKLSGLGVRYLVAQLAGIGMFQSQPLMIVHLLGPAQVGIFNIAQRILTLPLTVVQMFTSPLLSAYGEANARGDRQWIRRTLKASTLAAMLGALVLTVPLVVWTGDIVQAWVGEQMVPERSLVIMLGLYGIVAAAVTPASVMLYGLGRVGGQALYACFNSILTVGLGVWLTKTNNLTGMAAAMLIAVAIVNPLGQITEIRQVFQGWNKYGT